MEKTQSNVQLTEFKQIAWSKDYRTNQNKVSDFVAQYISPITKELTGYMEHNLVTCLIYRRRRNRTYTTC